MRYATITNFGRWGAGTEPVHLFVSRTPNVVGLPYLFHISDSLLEGFSFSPSTSWVAGVVYFKTCRKDGTCSSRTSSWSGLYVKERRSKGETTLLNREGKESSGVTQLTKEARVGNRNRCPWCSNCESQRPKGYRHEHKSLLWLKGDLCSSSSLRLHGV